MSKLITFYKGYIIPTLQSHLPNVTTNDLIIDVFGGSGTTSKVAVDLGYDTISYEIDEKYVEIINNRIK